MADQVVDGRNFSSYFFTLGETGQPEALLQAVVMDARRKVSTTFVWTVSRADELEA